MILADTSAWVEYLRATGSRAHRRVRALIAERGPLTTTEIVVMELLAGARDDEGRDRLRRLLYRFDLLGIQGLADYEAAAELYRACRRRGATVRKLTDCVIAAVAIRHGARVLHQDADFELIARHCGLRLDQA